MKESGIGREGSKYGVEEFLEVKYLCMGGIAGNGSTKRVLGRWRNRAGPLGQGRALASPGGCRLHEVWLADQDWPGLAEALGRELSSMAICSAGCVRLLRGFGTMLLILTVARVVFAFLPWCIVANRKVGSTPLSFPDPRHPYVR
jgi:hypothetical protein